MNLEDPESLLHAEMVRILRKKNKSASDIEALDSKFSNLKFFAEFKAKIDEESFAKLLKCLSYEKSSGHQVLFRKGDVGTKLYIILKGTVAVMINKPPKDIVPWNLIEKKKFTRLFDEYTSATHGFFERTKTSFQGLFGRMESLNTKENLPDFMSPQPRRREEARRLMTISPKKKVGNGFCKISIDDLDRYNILDTIPRIKMSRPVMKFAFWCSKHWSREFQTNPDFRKFIPYQKNPFFKYNVSYFTNKLLIEVRPKLTMELVSRLFPIWLDVLHMPTGASFGEIALLQNCTRQAGIYCLEDCEFATISKKGESDFEYLIKFEQ
jgi:CRP-like cAMP-binding protein